MSQHPQEKYFELTLLCLILLTGAILFYQALPFINGILGAITLYILLRRPNYLLAKKVGQNKASWIIVILITLFFMIPISLILWYAIDFIVSIDFNPQIIIQKFTSTINALEKTVGFELMSDKTLSFITAKITQIANMLMSGLNNFAVNLFTALLLLFFLLSGGMRMENYIARLLPFSKNNKKAIIERINLIVKSNAIGIPLLALLQGIVATIGYSLCEVNNALLFGLITGFASIIPIVGTMIVWIPLSIAQYFEGTLLSTIGLVVYGLVVISQCDNVLRLILQKKMANTHPLITIFGVIAGIPVFGFMGVIFGPLLVALFLLFTDMFANQYIAQNEDFTFTLKSHIPPLGQDPKAKVKDATFKEEQDPKTYHKNAQADKEDH